MKLNLLKIKILKKIYIVVCMLFVMVFTSCYVNTEKVCEQAYFEGQRDVLDGDVRIKRIMVAGFGPNLLGILVDNQNLILHLIVNKI